MPSVDGVAAAAATVKLEHVVPGVGQGKSGLFVPAAMGLNAMMVKNGADAPVGPKMACVGGITVGERYSEFFKSGHGRIIAGKDRCFTRRKEDHGKY